MKLRLRPALSLIAVSLMGCVMPPVSRGQNDKTDYGLVAGTVANMLMENHYSMKDFDDELSRKALQNFFDYLDYSRLYFTQAEIENFRSLYETKLDDYVFKYQIKPAKEIHQLYLKKIKDRAANIKALLEGGKLDFNTDKNIELSRKDAPWAASEGDLDELWTRQITREVLQERLILARAAERKKEKEAKDAAAAGKPEASQGTPPPAPEAAKEPRKTPDTPEQKVLKRYDRFLKVILEQDDEDVTNFFLSCIASAYDPHSEYLSAPEQDRFNIDMKSP
ncbi:MAG: carboxyl-terminal protease [Verrucomicrobiales bacterium]|nr:carboxyl-terminal protease [Verrucomicrobiales bacterium]